MLKWAHLTKFKNQKAIICDGSVRSGKTVSMILGFVHWAMRFFDGKNFGICGKTISSTERNIILPLLNMPDITDYYSLQYIRGENKRIIIRSGSHTDTFFIFGGKDESSYTLVQGITLSGVLFDEVALMPESFVNQATGRCSVDGSKYWFNCNPDGPYHWFKTGWIDKREEKHLLYLHFTMDDNLSLSEKIKERYRSMYTGVFYRRYILGLWAMAEGIIYDMFDTAKHVISNLSELTNANYYVSCDYGTQNATVFLLWCKDRLGRWVCCCEYYYSGRDEERQKTDTEYADDLEQWLDGIKPVKIVIDPSAASFIAELKKRGYAIKKAKNDVLDGIRFVASLLNQGKIAISDQCPNTIKEFGSYIWDQKASERGEDKPVKQHDHAMDALRYFCYTIIRKPGSISILK